MSKDKKRFTLKGDLERDRKYDSYIDEYKRMVSFGESIITDKKDQHDEIWEYTLSLLLSSFKPALSMNDIVPTKTIKTKTTTTEILRFKKNEVISIEQVGKDGTIKRITLENKGATFFGKRSRIDYSVLYKANVVQTGFRAAINKYVMKKREKVRAANIAYKICQKFNTKPVFWVKKYAQKAK